MSGMSDAVGFSAFALFVALYTLNNGGLRCRLSDLVPDNEPLRPGKYWFYCLADIRNYAFTLVCAEMHESALSI